VEVAVEAGRPQIDARGQALAVDLPAEPLCVDGDPDRLAQVLSNLINNASKYTPADGAISVSAERREARVAIRVADNGSGISPDVMPHIFELFAQEFRTHGLRTRRRSHPCAGGGLRSISRKAGRLEDAAAGDIGPKPGQIEGWPPERPISPWVDDRGRTPEGPSPLALRALREMSA
jgi:hypothetical protein